MCRKRRANESPLNPLHHVLANIDGIQCIDMPLVINALKEAARPQDGGKHTNVQHSQVTSMDAC